MKETKDTEATFLEYTNKTIKDYARIQLVLWPLVHTILLSRGDLGGWAAYPLQGEGDELTEAPFAVSHPSTQASRYLPSLLGEFPLQRSSHIKIRVGNKRECLEDIY